MTTDEAIANVRAKQRGNDASRSEVLLADEIERFRTLFASFQLECCEDWTCSEEHANRTATALHDARGEVERLRILLSNEQDAAKENVDRLRSELHEAQHCRQREHDLRVQFAGELESLRAENVLVTNQEVLTANWCAELQAENAELRARASADRSRLTVLEAWASDLSDSITSLRMRNPSCPLDLGRKS